MPPPKRLRESRRSRPARRKCCREPSPSPCPLPRVDPAKLNTEGGLCSALPASVPQSPGRPLRPPPPNPVSISPRTHGGRSLARHLPVLPLRGRPAARKRGKPEAGTESVQSKESQRQSRMVPREPGACEALSARDQCAPLDLRFHDGQSVGLCAFQDDPFRRGASQHRLGVFHLYLKPGFSEAP